MSESRVAAPTPTLPRSAREGAEAIAPTLFPARPVPSPAERGRDREGACALTDSTATTVRFGLKGPRAADWLQSHGLAIPDTANTWRALGDDSSLIARLGTTEFFLEQATPTALLEQLATQLRSPIDGVYPVLREDRAFVLEGPEANDVLAQVCNVDFNNVSRSERHVVMTMMIGIAVLVIPQENLASNGARSANGGCYRIWCDPTYGDYLQSSLQSVISGA